MLDKARLNEIGLIVLLVLLIFERKYEIKSTKLVKATKILCLQSVVIDIRNNNSDTRYHRLHTKQYKLVPYHRTQRTE